MAKKKRKTGLFFKQFNPKKHVVRGHLVVRFVSVDSGKAPPTVVSGFRTVDNVIYIDGSR